ncbi:MAG: GtrA family protein [Deltaproteobacteria bacterium]
MNAQAERKSLGKSPRRTSVSFSKSDLAASFIIGEVVALFLLAIIKNMEHEIPALDILLRFKWLALALIPLAAGFAVYLTSLLGRRRLVFFQAGKFVAIGLSNAAIDFGILNLLMHVSGIESGIYFSLFKAASFLVAIGNSYFWNKFWTFEGAQTKGIGFQFMQFTVVSGVGFLLNVGIASIIVNFVEPIATISPRLWANLATLAAVMVSVFWNFGGYKFLVFKK